MLRAPMPFSSLGLCSALLQALSERGYLVPTPIQLQAIGPGLQGRDILACAQHRLGQDGGICPALAAATPSRASAQPRRARALVLVPTRELCTQVGEVIRSLGVHLAPAPKVSIVFGGVSINPQMMRLRGGTDIVVATPGRLLDLVAQNALDLSFVATLVLDEADRLLELGFAEELERILALLPRKRQNLFFSATFAPAVQALAHKLLNEPLRIEVQSEPLTQPDIVQRAIAVDTGGRTQLLRHLITQNHWQRVLVFVATKHAAEMIADKLRKARINAEPFHGQLSQGKRTQVLADFKASRLKVVIATDVAARGLDIALLPVVVNYDLPRSQRDYTHRIGRTGRAGERGLALSFVSADSQAHFALIQKRQRLTMALEQIAGFEPRESFDAAPPTPGGVKGKRPNKKDKLRQAAARVRHAGDAS